MSSYTDISSLGTATLATSKAHFLAEGPVWDAARKRVRWVDIMDGAVHEGVLEQDGTITHTGTMQVPGIAAAVAVAHDGSLVVASNRCMYYVSSDGSITSGRDLIDVEGRRFNDGKPDPSGRFVVGTKGPGNEQLVVVENDEILHVLDDDLTLGNGLAWTSDGATLYTVDTFSQRIFVRDYNVETGEAGERRVFITLTAGFPDGMTIDTEDHLWVAVWGEGTVLRISPAGEIVSRVEVPAPHTSCPVFAGEHLDTLVITTAREDLSDEQLAAYPQSGHLFTFRPGVVGNPPHLWAGKH